MRSEVGTPVGLSSVVGTAVGLRSVVGTAVGARSEVGTPVGLSSVVVGTVTRTVNGTGHTGPSEFCATSI